jgi:hypothetical protein
MFPTRQLATYTLPTIALTQLPIHKEAPTPFHPLTTIRQSGLRLDALLMLLARSKDEVIISVIVGIRRTNQGSVSRPRMTTTEIARAVTDRPVYPFA